VEEMLLPYSRILIYVKTAFHPVSTMSTSDLLVYDILSQGCRNPRQLHVIGWCLILMGAWYGTYFMIPFCYL
jgi:hypothetical protein